MRDLTRIEEHQRYRDSRKDTRNEGVPDGCLHFRNCHDGCEAMAWFKTTEQLTPGGDRGVLSVACEQCDLDEAPYRGAVAALKMSLLPPEMTPESAPFSVVQGIAYLAMKRRAL